MLRKQRCIERGHHRCWLGQGEWTQCIQHPSRWGSVPPTLGDRRYAFICHVLDQKYPCAYRFRVDVRVWVLRCHISRRLGKRRNDQLCQEQCVFPFIFRPCSVYRVENQHWRWQCRAMVPRVVLSACVSSPKTRWKGSLYPGTNCPSSGRVMRFWVRRYCRRSRRRK